MRKKPLAMISILFLALILTGCVRETTQEVTEETGQSMKKEVTHAVEK